MKTVVLKTDYTVLMSPDVSVFGSDKCIRVKGTKHVQIHPSLLPYKPVGAVLWCEVDSAGQIWLQLYLPKNKWVQTSLLSLEFIFSIKRFCPPWWCWQMPRCQSQDLLRWNEEKVIQGALDIVFKYWFSSTESWTEAYWESCWRCYKVVCLSTNISAGYFQDN